MGDGGGRTRSGRGGQRVEESGSARRRGRGWTLLVATALVAGAAPARAQDGPIAVDDAIPVALTPMEILLDLGANDLHLGGDAFTVEIVSPPPPTHGSLLGPYHDGTLTYVLTQDLTHLGKITFTYRLRDSRGRLSDAAEVCIGDCPLVFHITAEDDTASGEVGQPISISVLQNDTGVDLVITSWTQGGLGTVVQDGDLLVYTGIQSGTDTFAYSIQDAGGGAASATVTVDVGPAAPGPPSTADFTFNCDGELSCWFDGRPSLPPQPEVRHYQWDFGDGSPPPNPNYWVNHVYQHPGNYLVTLSVVPWVGQTSSVSKLVEVVDDPPFANFDWTCNLFACTFWQAHPSPDTIGWDWTFCELSVCHQSSNSPSGSFNYGGVGPGVHEVTLTVTDGHTSSSFSRDIVVQAPQEEVWVEINWCEAYTCEFAAVGPDLPHVSDLQWAFVPSGSASGAVVTQTFGRLGTVVAWLHFLDRWGQPQQRPGVAYLGEDVKVEAGEAIAWFGSENTVWFHKVYDTPPVVVVQPLIAPFSSSPPAVVRITAVENDRFTFVVQAPGDTTLDPELAGGQRVTYLVAQPGHWQMPNGTLVEAERPHPGFPPFNPSSPGYFHTLAGGQAPRHEFWRNWFRGSFAEPPAVFAQVQTANDESYVTARVKDVTRHFFDFAFEQEEAATDERSAVDTIGWIAVSSGAGTWRTVTGDEVPAEAALGVPELGGELADVALAAPFGGAPLVIAGLASWSEALPFGFSHRDAATLRRHGAATSAGFRVRVQEDTTWDQETHHDAVERAAWLAVGKGGPFEAAAVTIPSSAIEPRSDHVRVRKGRSHHILVLANDERNTNPPLTVTGLGWNNPPEHGSWGMVRRPHVLNVGRAVGYHPFAGYVGPDSFDYEVGGGALGRVFVQVEDGPSGVLFEEHFDPLGGTPGEPSDGGTLPGGWVAIDEEGTTGASRWTVTRGRELRHDGDIAPASPGSGGEGPGTHLLWQGGGAWEQVMAAVRVRADAPGTVGVVFRYQDPDHHYRFTLSDSGLARLVRRWKGENTVLWEEAGHPLRLGAWYSITVRLVIDQVTVTASPEGGSLVANDVQVSLTDPALAWLLVDGSFGIFASNARRVYFDDVVVTEVIESPSK